MLIRLLMHLVHALIWLETSIHMRQSSILLRRILYRSLSIEYTECSLEDFLGLLIPKTHLAVGQVETARITKVDIRTHRERR